MFPYHRFVEAVLWIVGREARGVIFRRSSATGTRFSNATATGLKRMFSPGFSRPAPTRRHSPWSTPLSSRSITTDSAQKRTQSQAIGRSKGGMTTKILALTDALGNLVRFVLLLRMVSDTLPAPPARLERSHIAPVRQTHSSADDAKHGLMS